MTTRLLVADADAVIYHGDALAVLAGLEARSVQCIVTSPPFWGLRDYGVDGQIGLEATPDEWVAALVAVFREARRVLRDDGVLWVEVGDTYAGGGMGDTRGGFNARYAGDHRQPGKNETTYDALPTRPPVPDNVKAKDLVGAPWLLAFALRADGWYLRADCIWHRPNPMPESVTDRPTKAHSYVFLLTKRARYYYDADAIRDEYRYDGRRAERWPGAGANARTVWTIATEPTPFAHFATFPQALVERCIKAGTSEHGACGVCGAPWQRVVERAKAAGSLPAREGGHPNGLSRNAKGGGPAYVKWKLANPDVLKGWAPTCDHAAATVRPCVVLDPFMGSGTTALVARRLGRRSVGVELSAAYGAIAARRLQQLSLFSEQAPA